jgi:hypothetical protein
MVNWGKGGGRPQLKTRKSVRSVLLTSECFTLGTHDGEDCLFIGTKSNSLGVLKWVRHCEYQEPRQISVSILAWVMAIDLLVFVRRLEPFF